MLEFVWAGQARKFLSWRPFLADRLSRRLGDRRAGWASLHKAWSSTAGFSTGRLLWCNDFFSLCQLSHKIKRPAGWERRDDHRLS